MQKILITIILLLVARIGVHSQNLQIFDIDTSNFPNMKAEFYAFDKDGKQITNLNASDFEVSENDQPRNVTFVSCPTPKPVAISSILTIDVSGSMDGTGLQNAKTAAKSWINGLPLGKSECGITSFSDDSYLIQDFTTDRNKLIQSVEKLSPIGSTDYDAAYWTTLVSGLEIAKRGQHKKVLVFLSDGYPNSEPQTQKIISLALQYNVVVYCVTLDMPAPQCLKDIAKQTGGEYFENLTTEEEARATYLKILNIAQELSPCTIEWESEVQCPKSITNVELEHIGLKISAKNMYPFPKKAKAYLKLKPVSLNFRNIPIGTSKDTTVTITANNADFNITNISGTNLNFKIKPTSFSLKKDETKTLTVTYTPTDSLINFCTFNIENDLCKTLLYVRGGFKGQKTKNSTFKISAPNGGEKYGIGTDTEVSWEGCADSDHVNLDFSIDNGKTWENICKNVNGYKYKWQNIPNTPSKVCLIKGTISNESFGQLIRTFTSHTGNVISVAFSYDGTTLVSGSWDKTIKLWDVATGKEIRTLNGHSSNVLSVAFSPDRTTLATGSSDRTIKLWDWATGKEIRTLNGHKDYVNCVAFSYDGTTLASGSYDNTIMLWEVGTGMETKTLSGHTDWVSSVEFKHQGNTLASGSGDGTIKLWDVETGEEIKTLEGHSEEVSSVAFNTDGNTLASGGIDGTIKLWDVETGEEIKTLEGHSDYVNSVAFNTDGNTLASGSYDETIKLWDVETGEEIKTLEGHSDWVYSVDFSPDGTTLASGSWDKTIKLWDMEDGGDVSDVSDNVWEIVAPSVEIKTIDMGKVLVGRVKDSVVKAFIVNKSDCKLRVDSVFIKGSDEKMFRVSSYMFPDTLEALSSKNIEFSFMPSSVGIKNTKVYVYTPTDNLITDITGEGVQPLISVENKIIDFGKVTVGSYKDTITVTTIKNIGSSPLIITNLKHNKPNDVDFTTLIGGGSFTLAPGESKKMDLRFMPSTIGRTMGTLEFHYDGVGSPTKVFLYGQGLGGSVAIANDSAYVNKEFKIKLKLLNDIKPKTNNILTYYKVKLSYNPTIIYVNDLRATKSLNQLNEVIEIIGEWDGSSNILGEFSAKAALGNEEISEILLEEFYWLDENKQLIDFETEKTNGTFKLLGICQEGGTRLLNPNGKIQINAIKPNPAYEQIEIELSLLEKTGYKLTLVNNLGQTVREINRTESSKGTANENIQLADLSAGVYNLILQTETETLFEVIVIVR